MSAGERRPVPVWIFIGHVSTRLVTLVSRALALRLFVTSRVI
jgi:hypothetical protein